MINEILQRAIAAQHLMITDFTLNMKMLQRAAMKPCVRYYSLGNQQRT